MLSNPQKTAVTYDNMPSAKQLLGKHVMGRMSGKVLLQTTWDGTPVSAEDGFNSPDPLLGITECYSKHYGWLTVNDKLPKLDASAVVVFKMKFTGCACPVHR